MNIPALFFLYLIKLQYNPDIIIFIFFFQQIIILEYQEKEFFNKISKNVNAVEIPFFFLFPFFRGFDNSNNI